MYLECTHHMKKTMLSTLNILFLVWPAAGKWKINLLSNINTLWEMNINTNSTAQDKQMQRIKLTEQKIIY